MRLLLDESVPHRPGNALPAHTVNTVVEMGWGASGTGRGKIRRLHHGRQESFLSTKLGSAPVACGIAERTLQ